MISKLPTLEKYVDADVDVDHAERVSDEEIVAAVNDQLNPVLDNNESMLEMSNETESETIPTDKQTIQAIDCIRQFTLVDTMDDTSATEKFLCLTTILEQKVMQEKAL